MKHPVQFNVLQSLFVLAFLLTSLGLSHPSTNTVQAQSAQAPVTPLPPITEIEPNDQISPNDQATSIGASVPGGPIAWQQTITGVIGTAEDLDWYRVALTPASTMVISLTNLSADFDLVLGSAANGLEQGSEGLENVQDLGGRINAIGGRINAIGGRINAIGGRINAIGGRINAISANPGTAPESIDTFLWQPGVYYIAVSGSNGAFSSRPYTLQVHVTGNNLAVPPPAPNVQLNISSDPNITTLYLFNRSRMRERYPQSSVTIAQIRRDITQLATENPGNGFVIDLDDLQPASGQVESIADIYRRWDNSQANPLEANRVAQLVDNVISAATLRNPSGPTPTLTLGRNSNSAPPFPNVQHIVIIGGDSVIPFFRVPDLTTIANEGDYAAYLRTFDAQGVIDPNSPQGAALRYRTLQTDNIYGADKSYRFLGYPLFIPNRAVGRLVEHPDDIARYLAPYVSGVSIGSRVPTDRAFVSGYDFLIDQAQAVSQTLSAVGFTGSNSITGLINNSWTSQDLANRWFDGRLDTSFGPTYDSAQSPYKLQSVNAHFDHWQVLPANQQAGTFYAQRIYTPTVVFSTTGSYFINKLGYSVGCHSGFNVLDDSVRVSNPSDLLRYRTDFAQAYVKQGGNWIGNTGYGYGTTDGVDYSERLSVLLTQELGRDVRGSNGQYVGQAIGTALVHAKQRYIRNATDLGPYDAKILSITTLYGLPFMPISVPNPQPPPAEDRDDAPARQNAPPVPTPPLGTLERIITFTLKLDNADVFRTGSKYPVISEINAEDSFVKRGFRAQPEPRLFQANQAGFPTLPQFAYDLSSQNPSGSDRLEVRGVSFLGGSYNPQAGYNPQITQLITEPLDFQTLTSNEPTFAAGAGIWYPDIFFKTTSVGEGPGLRDQLVVSAAQFRADRDGTIGTMRTYSQMVFKVTYTDPAASDAQRALNDTNPPQIETVRVVPASSNTALQAAGVNVIVSVTDALAPGDPNSTGVASVNAIYIVDDQTWIPVTFTRAANLTGAAERWTATVPVPQVAALRIIVSATDNAGNVAFYTAKGAFAQTQNQVLMPLIRR